MPFRFQKQDADLTAALRRIAAEMLERAAQEDDVREARKRVKKLRALLRLVRPGMKAARGANDALRTAAAGLAPVRDAQAMLAVHDRLGGAADGWVRATLAARLTAAEAAGDGGHAFRQALVPVTKAAARWSVKGDDAEVLAAGLVQTRKRGVAGLVAIRDGGGPEALHDWRREVKALWYQARLLAPVWPEAMEPVAAGADALGKALGDHHDLSIFRTLIGGMAEAEAPAVEVLALRASARRQMADIEATALPLGARLFAGPPEAVATLWSDWWRLWRRGR